MESHPKQVMSGPDWAKVQAKLKRGRSLAEAGADEGDAGSASAALAEVSWRSVLHPRSRKGQFREVLGRPSLPGQRKPASGGGPLDDLSVDNAIGGVLGSFHGVKDWNIYPGEGLAGKHWDVHIEHGAGKSLVRVTEDGTVTDIARSG